MTLKLVDPEKVGLSPQRLQRLMEVLQGETDKKRLPGAVALVARHGQVACSKAWANSTRPPVWPWRMMPAFASIP